MRKIVKQSLDVEFQNPIIFPAPLTRDAHGVQSRLSRSVAVRVRQEDGFQFRLNHLFDHRLRDPITDGGHT
jgi:hypothetical protein